MRFTRLALSASALAFVACGGGGDQPPAQNTQPPVTGGTTGTVVAMPATGTVHTIRMTGSGESYKFEPAAITIKAGDAIKFIWSDATVKIRMLSYRMCQLGLGADSLHKLVLVHCIEATGKVSLEHSALVARDLGSRSRKPLVYFGAHHVETEASHTLEDGGVQGMLTDIHLDPELSRELVTLVDRSFEVFTAFADELLAFARRGLHIGPG